jgi:hypothetical protein
MPQRRPTSNLTKTRLIKNHPDWPRVWSCTPHGVKAKEVSQYGILMAVTISDRGLHLRAKVKHKTCDGYFFPKQPDLSLKVLRDIFLAYRHCPKHEIENLEL